MSKIGLVIIWVLMAGRICAQQDYFVLIQADNSQPFYIRMEDKTFSSSAQGHLILSQLKEDSYTITIGFPKKLFPEQQFSFSLHKRDLEFQLKDLGEKGWGLFNPQTQELKMADEKKDGGARTHLEGVKKDDAFSRLMAGVVSDTAVMYNTYAMEATLKDSPAVSKAVPSSGISPATASRIPLSGRSPAGLPANAPAGVPDSGASHPDSAVTGNKGDSSRLTSPGSFPVTGLPAPAASVSGAPGKDTALFRKDTVLSVTNKGEGVESSNKGVETESPKAANLPDTSASARVIEAVKKGDTAAYLPDSGAVTGIKQPTAAASTATPGMAPLHKAGPVVKLSERKTAKGMRLVYADHMKGQKADTIVVIIPVDTVARLADSRASTGSAATVPDSLASLPGRTPDRPASSPDRLASSGGTESASSKTSSSGTILSRPDTVQKKTASRVLFINSDCRNFATDYDVDKLRVKLLETAKDEDRLIVARKVFKTKCFSTKQIRALSEVFTADAQKFKFFETAYPFVSDEHFKELRDLLADPVYSNKFKTMTGQ